MGALVHASLASQSRQIDLIRPPNLTVEEWSDAVDGRVMHLQVDMQQVSETWWIIGIYQHVAKPENALRRQRVLECLADIKQRADRAGFCLLILGDANAAPPNGRWFCPPHSPLHASDALMLEWAQHQGLTEVGRPRLVPTWRACLKRCSAVLDRAWYSPASLGIPKVHTRWAEVEAQLDHALIFVDLPSSRAGIGFAAACRDGWQEHQAPRLKVDMPQLHARRDQYTLALAEAI
jgi:hypothetical protein